MDIDFTIIKSKLSPVKLMGSRDEASGCNPAKEGHSSMPKTTLDASSELFSLSFVIFIISKYKRDYLNFVDV